MSGHVRTPLAPLGGMRPEDWQKLVAARRQAVAATAEAMRGAKRIIPTRAIRRGPKIGRNEPCPCGSGAKWKRCHGRSV